METLRPALSEEPIDADYQRFFETVQDFAENPPRHEPVIGAFYKAVLIASETIPAYGQLIRDYLHEEPVKISSYRVNKFFKSHQTLLVQNIALHAEDYPLGFEYAQKWLEYLSSNLSNPNLAQYQKLRETLRMPDQKNTKDRAKALAFAASILSVRQNFEDAPIFHEYGTSNGHVLKALASRDISMGLMVKDDKNLATLDVAHTALFKTATARPAFGRGFGVEAQPPRTQADIERIKAFTLAPSEFDTSVEDSFDKLAAADLGRRVVKLQGDFKDLGPRARRMLLKNPADIAFLSHTLSQDSDIDGTIESILPYMRPRGFIVINEYATVDPHDHSMTVVDNWDQQWQCMTGIIRVKNVEEGVHEIVRWKTSHCKEGVLNEEELGRLTFNKHLANYV